MLSDEEYTVVSRSHYFGTFTIEPPGGGVIFHFFNRRWKIIEDESFF